MSPRVHGRGPTEQEVLTQLRDHPNTVLMASHARNQLRRGNLIERHRPAGTAYSVWQLTKAGYVLLDTYEFT